MSEPYDYFASPSGQPNQPAQPQQPPAQPAQPAPGTPQADRFGGYGTPAPGYGSPQFGASTPAAPAFGANPYAPAPAGYPAGPGMVGGAYPYAARPGHGLRPGVTLAAAVLTFVVAGIFTCCALGFLFLATVTKNADQIPSEFRGSMTKAAAVALIVFGLLALVNVIVGRGLLTGSHGSFVLALVLNSIALLIAVLPLLGGDPISPVFAGAIPLANLILLTRPSSRAWFSGRR